MTEGIYPALITPFTDDDKINENALCDVIDRLLAKGVDGFYVGGSTSEVTLLSMVERMQVLNVVTAHVGRRADIIAHIGCQYTGDSIRLARHAEGCGVTAISSLPPIFFKYTTAELEQYYLDIAGATSLPLVIYNAPAMTGISFNAANTASLFAQKNIVGIKFTAHNLYEMQRLISAYPCKTVFNGHDEIYLNTLVLGVRHAIGSTFNFMPDLFIEMRKSYENGELNKARALQGKANIIIEGLLEVGMFRGIKGIMRHLGQPVGNCRKPFAPLSAEEMKKLEPLAALCE